MKVVDLLRFLDNNFIRTEKEETEEGRGNLAKESDTNSFRKSISVHFWENKELNVKCVLIPREDVGS